MHQIHGFPGSWLEPCVVSGYRIGPMLGPVHDRKGRLKGPKQMGFLQLEIPAGVKVLVPFLFFFYLDVSERWHQNLLSCQAPYNL